MRSLLAVVEMGGVGSVFTVQLQVGFRLEFESRETSTGIRSTDMSGVGSSRRRDSRATCSEPS